ncbi:MAG: cell division protein FtsA [Gammaproteobacteria bacterium]
MMSKKQDKNWVVGLDIGTSKIVVLVGEITEDEKLDIVGVGCQPSFGLKKGVVVNVDATVQSLQKAVEEAEIMAGCSINSVYTGIAGSHIRSINSHGIVAIHDNEVSAQDVERVLEAAKAVPIPADQKILHALPQEFVVDGQDGIKDPIGMSGIRLEARVHMVTGAVSAAQNIVKCIRRCGLEVEDMVLQPLASSYAVLTEDEKQLGVCLIDIGGGTTDVAVFVQGAICHTAVIPIAGDQITNDLAVALRVPSQSAEALKVQYACAMRSLVADQDTVEVEGLGDRPNRIIPRYMVAEVVEPRYEELFSLVHKELLKSGMLEKIHAGIVLTGGSSRMEGVLYLAEDLFQLPVRLGLPRDVTGLVDVVKNPSYATGVGLLLYGHQSHLRSQLSLLNHPGLKGWFRRAKRWFQGNF